MATYDAQILQRRDTKTAWETTNPILESGEVGYEIVPGLGDQMKVGDGISTWKDLPYAYAGLSSNTFTGVQNEAHGDPIASASTVNLNTATGNFVEITGTTQINLITLSDGFERTVRFSGVLTLKHGAKLKLLGGEDIVTAPGDVAIFRGDAAGAVQMVAYSRSDGKALKETTAAATIYGKRGRNIASAASINLNTATGDYVWITGRATISTIVLDEGAERTVRFDKSLTLTHNPAAIDLPSKANIETATGDTAIIRGDKSGIVRVIAYQRADGNALVGGGGSSSSSGNQLLWVHGVNIASASTVDLNAATGDFVYITGEETINDIILTNGQERTVRFVSALTLTHDAANINLPGKADIITAVGDIAVFRGDTGGKIRCVSYQRANGKAIIESGAPPFSDAQPLLQDALDATKQVRFELSELTPETTRVFTTPDKDGVLATLEDVAAMASAGTLPVADTTFIAKGATDPTKRVRLELDTLLDTATDVVLTIPNKDITLAGLDDIDDAVAGISLPVADATAIARGSVDATKKVRFEVDTLLTTGATRVLTVPDKDMTLAGLDDLDTLAAELATNTVLNPTISPYTIPDYKNAYVIVPVGGAFTVKLNATPNDGDVSTIIAPSDADTNPVTVNRNGITINGVAANYVLNAPNTAAVFVYNADANDWRRYSLASEVLGAIDAILTGFVAGAGTVTDADSILTALEKVVGNLASKLGGATGGTDNRLLRSDGTGGATVQASPIGVGDSGEISGYRANVVTFPGATATIDESTVPSGSIVRFTNGSAVAATIASNVAANWCCTCYQIGAGQVTFTVGGGGSLLNYYNHTKTAGKKAAITLFCDSNIGSPIIYLAGISA